MHWPLYKDAPLIQRTLSTVPTMSLSAEREREGERERERERERDGGWGWEREGGENARGI